MSGAEGYYWVSDSDADPEIAELREGTWWLIGSEEPAITRHVAVLSERLVAPRRRGTTTRSASAAS